MYEHREVMKKIQTHSSCEIEDFCRTQLFKRKMHSSCEIDILSKLVFASCVRYSDRAYYRLCVLIKDIGRGLPLQLQCSYQRQQGDVIQSVHANYKTRF